MGTESTNTTVHLPDFVDRAFARPRLDGEDPAVASARRILEECTASPAYEHGEDEIWIRCGALQSAVQGLLDLIRAQAES